MDTTPEIKFNYQKSCYYCNNNEVEVYQDNLFDSYSKVDVPFEVHKCNACKMLFTYPFIVNENVSFLYEGNYFSIKNELSTFERLFRYDQYRYDLSIYKNYIQENSRVLDWGCGDGSRVEFLRSKNINAEGIDKYFDNVHKGKEVFSYEDPMIKAYSHKYDVVSLFHVLEHLPELDKTLEKIREECLTEDGVLVIQVPNTDCWQFRKTKYKSDIYDIPRHYWHFNEENLTLVLEKNGFKVEKVHQKNALFHPNTLINTLFAFNVRNKWAETKQGGMVSGLFNIFRFGLYNLLSVPIVFFENLRNNSSLITVVASIKK